MTVLKKIFYALVAIVLTLVVIGFLLPRTSLDASGPEAKAARQLAEKLTAATPVIAGPGGTFGG